MATSIQVDFFAALGSTINRLSEVLNIQDIEQNDCLQDAAMHRFKIVIELFWPALKKILAYEKIDSTTPRDVLSKAFQFELINDEAVWLKMLDDRNNTSHVYKQEDARRVFTNIQTYLPVFVNTYLKLQTKYALTESFLNR